MKPKPKSNHVNLITAHMCVHIIVHNTAHNSSHDLTF